MATISLARGWPSPDLLPVEELADCSRVALERDGGTILSYGPASGYGPLRAWLAEEHGLLVLEDDPYGLVRFEGEAPPSLHELSGGETAYSSSFSKTVSPGSRVGWFVLPEQLAADLAATATATYITPVLLGQATVHEFIQRGSFEPNLERVQGLLRARRDAMLAALESELPGARWSHPEG